MFHSPSGIRSDHRFCIDINSEEFSNAKGAIMENDFWLNLASKDLKKSKEFFTKIGFKINERQSAPHMVSMIIGTKEIILNLFLESDMQSYSQNTVSDPSESTEILFSLGVKSRSEVDQLAEKVVAAGGILYNKPGEKNGWMYGCGFVDPDGHRWSALYMDMSKMPKS
jgi:predicted lactoylglutathione lyase